MPSYGWHEVELKVAKSVAEWFGVDMPAPGKMIPLSSAAMMRHDHGYQIGLRYTEDSIDDLLWMVENLVLVAEPNTADEERMVWSWRDAVKVLASQYEDVSLLLPFRMNNPRGEFPPIRTMFRWFYWKLRKGEANTARRIETNPER